MAKTTKSFHAIDRSKPAPWQVFLKRIAGNHRMTVDELLQLLRL
jgi:hypothetical protein